MTATSARAPAPIATASERRLGRALAVVAAANLVPALWMAVAPHSFHEGPGAFGPYNSHYLGDAAAFQGAIGAAVAVSIVMAPLRLGALATACVATALHVVNHWIDVGDAHEGSNAGWLDAVSLTFLLAFTVVVTRAAWRADSR